MDNLMSQVRHSVKFVYGSDTIETVVRAMKNHNISSVLVLDDEQVVTGIITERDIVKKFTLLSMEDKLKAKANALMTRPVHFADLKHLHRDIKDLHFKKRVRHFPVYADEPMTQENIVGMMTATDLCRRYLRKVDEDKLEDDRDAPKVLLVAGAAATMRLTKLLKIMGCSVLECTSFEKQIGEKAVKKIPILIDMDHVYEDFEKIVSLSKTHEKDVVFISHKAKKAKELRGKLREKHLHVMMKPIDISFLGFLFEL